MIHFEGWPAIFFGIAILAISAILVMLYFFVFRAWVRAVLYGAPIPMVTILTMRLRGNPPMLLIDAYSALRRAGAHTTISQVEETYIDNRTRVRTSADLIALVKSKATPQAS
jgi:uncharacterized protein YqfA (UPF0365 family)